MKYWLTTWLRYIGCLIQVPRCRRGQHFWGRWRDGKGVVLDYRYCRCCYTYSNARCEPHVEHKKADWIEPDWAVKSRPRWL